MKKGLKLLLIAALALTAALSGCEKSSQPPEFKALISGSLEAPSVVGLNRWDNAVFKREDTLIRLMKENGAEDLPLASIGGEIALYLDGKAPDLAVLSECVIDTSGEPKYPDYEPNHIDIAFKDGKAAFSLMNALSPESSEIVIRGFKLKCSWADNECEYAFAVRSAAGIYKGRGYISLTAGIKGLDY